MKNIFLITTAFFIIAATAMAQTPKPFNLYAGGGLTVPTSKFDNAYKMGYHGYAAIGYKTSPLSSLIATAEYHSLKNDLEGFDGSFSGFMFGAAFVIRPSLPATPAKPFGLFGIGLMSSRGADYYDSTAVAYVNPEISNDFYFEFGGGLEFGSGPLHYFIEARYVNVNTDPESSKFVPITVGLKF